MSSGFETEEAKETHVLSPSPGSHGTVPEVVLVLLGLQ